MTDSSSQRQLCTVLVVVPAVEQLCIAIEVAVAWYQELGCT
jgi:hypothetical protein